jgi:uncharacterized membrane protein
MGLIISCSSPHSSSTSDKEGRDSLTEKMIQNSKVPVSDQPVMFGGNPIRATGNEPFWMLELKSDTAIFKLLGGAEYHELLPKPALNTTDSLKYLLELKDGTTLNILIINHPCIDNMSGFKKRFTAVVTSDQKGTDSNYEGCADFLSEYSKVMEGN